MKLIDYVKEFKLALNDEIEAVRKNEGQKTFLSKGKYLGKSKNKEYKYIYSFVTDTELLLPEDVEADLEYKKDKFDCIIISIDGFEINIGLQKKLDSEQIDEAILFTEPWFLLEKLKERLETISNITNQALAEKLLTNHTESSIEDLEDTFKILSNIERRTNKKISYNDSQLSAIDHVLHNQVSFIWGPPGTGKTKTLGLTVASLWMAGETVLVLGHSNAAVDTAMKSVAKSMEGLAIYEEEGLVLRYGAFVENSLKDFPKLNPLTTLKKKYPELIKNIEYLKKQINSKSKELKTPNLTQEQKDKIQNSIEEVKKILKPLNCELKQKQKELIAKAQVVGCTLSKAVIAPEIYERYFDAVIIDEASMAYIPQCIFSSTLAKKRVAIFGDFRQLGPISQAKTKKTGQWLERDIFEQAEIVKKVSDNRHDARLVLLDEQYRMYPTICQVPNGLFYNNKLKNGKDLQEHLKTVVKLEPSPNNAIIFYDIAKLLACCNSEQKSHSRYNIISALIAAQIAWQISQKNDYNIGIITPYNAQSRLIHRILKDINLMEKVKAATVHRFQGSEQEIIIFDSTEGPHLKPGKLLKGGLDSTAARLSNVAISRAKGKFIYLNNYSYVKENFQTTDIFQRFTESVKKLSDFQSLSWSSQEKQCFSLSFPGLEYFPSFQEALKQLETSFSLAKQEIAIRLSSTSSNNILNLNKLRKLSSNNVRFFLAGQAETTKLNNLSNTKFWDKNSRTNINMIGIDRNELWIFINPANHNAPVLRLKLKDTIDLIYAFCRLVPEKEQILTSTPWAQCPKCKQPLSLSENYRYPSVVCSNKSCGYKRPARECDATIWAKLNKFSCRDCNGQAQGRKSSFGLFLGCSNYPKCKWTMEF